MPPYAEAAGEVAETARKLLGNGKHDMNAMDYAGSFAAALNVSTEQMPELFVKIGAGVGKAVAAIAAKGDAATTQERLVLAAMDLSAVAARAAPEPFGKDVEAVFDAAWHALIAVLPNVDVVRMSALF